MANSPLLIAVERCQLCSRTRKQFCCQTCIANGNFVYSGGVDKTSFAEKQKRIKVILAVQNDCLKRLQGGLDVKASYNKKLGNILLLKNKIEMLTNAIKYLNTQNKIDIEKQPKLLQEIAQRKELIRRMIRKTEEIKDGNRIQAKKEKLQQYKEKLIQKQFDLKTLRIAHVQALVSDIFPLSEREVYPEFGTPPSATFVTQVSCNDVISDRTSSAEVELEEATRTVHIGGKWVSQNSQQMEDTIVEVGLPSSGDFIKYFEWLKSYRTEPRNPESQSGLHVNPLLSIPAALKYAGQLTDGLSFFLGVNLPRKIEYNDFSILQVSRQRLYQTINKLSDNIMFLCFSQLVSPSILHPNHILKNLSHCITAENLAWHGPFNTYEYKLIDNPFDSDSSAEELNYDSDSESASVEQEDWDQLMDLPFDHRDIQSETPSPSFEHSNRDRSLSSSASGLVTSAAASVASALWSWKR